MLNIVILVFGQKYLKMLLFEPSPINQPHADLRYVWRHWVAFATLTAITIILEISIIVVNIIHIRVSKKVDDDDEEISISISMPRTAKILLAIIHFLFLAAAFIMFVMSLASIGRAFSGSAPCRGCNSHCDPLVPEFCMLPFPSTFHMTTDNTTETGLRVNIAQETLPSLKSGEKFKPDYFNEMDGFSTIAQLAFYLKGAVNNSFIDSLHIEDFALADASTFIMEADTHELHPHWVEIDLASDSDEPLILIQPASPLKFGTRYIVGVRNVLNQEGEFIEPSDEFKLLMSPNKPSQTGKADRWSYYQDEILPQLTDAGYTALNEFQLIWDFTTVSRKSSLSHEERMRDLSLDYVEKTEVKYDILSEKTYTCSEDTYIWKSVHITLYLPHFLETTDKMSHLPRVDGEREVKIRRLKRHNIYMRIPCSLKDSPQVAERIIQYGHGLFNSRKGISTEWIDKMAHDNKWVFVASDWIGMSRFDLLSVGKIILHDVTNFVDLPESTVQGWADMASALRVITNQISNDERFTVEGIKILNCSNYVFYGNSQGAIIGGGYLASSKDMERGILHVPGTPFGLILSRSDKFGLFKFLLEMNMYNFEDVRMTLILIQSLWDAGESAGWLRSMNQETPPDVPPKQVLMQATYGDGAVATAGAAILARAYQADLVAPQYRDFYGLTPNNGPFIGSGLIEVYYNDSNTEYADNKPPRGGVSHHTCLRYEPEIIDQTIDFIRTGEIVNHCNGICIKEKCVHKIVSET